MQIYLFHQNAVLEAQTKHFQSRKQFLNYWRKF
jgi:hypothetical protein